MPKNIVLFKHKKCRNSKKQLFFQRRKQVLNK